MAKDPAFLFYPNDFDCATKFFTDAQVGIFIRLLIAQFQHGHLSEKQVIFISKNFDNEIMSKFKKDENGCFYSERLDNEMNKRKKFTESRKKNLKSKHHMDSHMEHHMASHMENENENENESIKINKSKFSISEILPANYVESAQMQLYTLKKKRMEESLIQSLWQAFRLEKIADMRNYHTEHDIYKHFINWIKTQKFEDGKQNRYDAFVELANRYNPPSGEIQENKGLLGI